MVRSTEVADSIKQNAMLFTTIGPTTIEREVRCPALQTQVKMAHEILIKDTALLVHSEERSQR